MRRLLFFTVLMTTFFCAFAQDKIIKHPFTMETWDTSKKCFKDTTCYVSLNIEGGKLIVMAIDLRTTTPGVKTIWLRLDGKNISQYPTLVKSLKSIRNKFRSWIKTAKENKITDYSKAVNDDIISMPAVDVYFKIDENSAFRSVSLSGRKPTVRFSPMFKVDDKGNMSMVVYSQGIYGFRNVPIHGYVPSIWSMIITDVSGANKEKFPLGNFYGLDFGSPEQIQSLIDALDYSKELEELQQIEQEKKQRKENIDKLFK